MLYSKERQLIQKAISVQGRQLAYLLNQGQIYTELTTQITCVLVETSDP